MKFKIVSQASNESGNLITEFEANDKNFFIFLSELKHGVLARVPNREMPLYINRENIIYISRVVEVP